MPVLRFLAVGLAKTLSKAFGLATVTFFGRMPTRDSDRIALVGVASLTWLALVGAAIWPSLADLVIPFGPDDETAKRIIAVALAVLVPPCSGAVVSTMHNNRPGGRSRRVGHVVSGYVYTPIIGLTVTALVVTVPVIKASYLFRRFTVERVMVMVPAGTGDRVLEHLQELLRAEGISCEEHHENRLVRMQFRWLSWVLGRVFKRDVAAELRALRGRDRDAWFEVTLHAADIAIIGARQVAHHIRAIIADGLDERIVSLTWDDGAQALEQRIRAARASLDAGEPPTRADLASLVRELGTLQLDQEPWDAVRRLVYRLERDAERERCALEHGGTSTRPAPVQEPANHRRGADPSRPGRSTAPTS